MVIKSSGIDSSSDEKNMHGVFFDLDGTLLDTMPDFMEAIKILLNEEGMPMPKFNENEFKHCISFGAKQIIKYSFKIEESNEKFAHLLQRFLKLYQETKHQNAKPFLGIENLLKILNEKNITWGIVTNKPTYLTEEIINYKTYLQKAKVVVCGDTTPYEKPHPEPLLYASKKVNLPSSSCIYVGDAKRDILAGNEAGMTTATALYGYIPCISEATRWPASFIAKNVEALTSWIISSLKL